MSHQIASATTQRMNQPEAQKRYQFEALLIEHHMSVRASIWSLGDDPDWVDDLAQEAFLTAYQSWDSFDRSRDFGRWVRGIAANLVRNEMRKDQRSQRILRTDLTMMFLDRTSRLVDSAEPSTVDTIRQCFSELILRSRALILGRYRNGETAPGLANRFKLTTPNIRQLIVRIRRQLKQCVELRVPKEELP